MAFDSSHVKVFLTQSNLEPDEAVSFVSSPNCGAISLFLGTTRETEPNDVKTKISSEESECPENLSKMKISSEESECPENLSKTKISSDERECPENLSKTSSDERECLENLSITGLHYEVYEEMAMKLMTEIAREICLEKGVSKCYLVHRTGYVPVGQASILIAASSPHRNEAHSAVMQVLNQVKAKVPVWKKVLFLNADPFLPNGCWSDKSEAFWLNK